MKLTMDSVIKVKDLTYRYPGNSQPTLNGVNLSLKPNHILGIIGPNGAGKSTLISILEGLRHHYTGEVTILGNDMKRQARQAQRQMGVLFQTSGNFENLKIKEILDVFGSMYHQTVSVPALLSKLKIEKISNIKYDQLSGGQKQKFGIALSLINQPKLLFLDEPTTGLDPDARLELWQIINHIRSQTTIVLCSHYMDEVERLCDEVAFIADGRVYASGTPEQLIDQSKAKGQVSLISFSSDVTAKVKQLFVPALISEKDGRLIIHVEPTENVMKKLYQLSDEVGDQLSDIKVKAPTLTDAYYQITGKQIGDGQHE